MIREIREKLDTGTEPDIITFSGSGEPTLHSHIGEMINWIKDNTSHKVAVLTNSSLLWMPDVRRELARADVVVPSLDAADESTFKKINRPAEGLSYNRIVDGLAEFSRTFEGQLWLEILVVEGRTGRTERSGGTGEKAGGDMLGSASRAPDAGRFRKSGRKRRDLNAHPSSVHGAGHRQRPRR